MDAEGGSPAPPFVSGQGGGELLGRGLEVSALLRMLQDGRGGLVTLTGLPGAGKTAVALEVAERLASGGMRMAVALADMEEAPEAWARGLTPGPLGDGGVGRGQAAAAVRGTPAAETGSVLVADFGDRPAAAGADALLDTAAIVLVVRATPLRVRGERRVPLGPLAVPVAGDPPAGPALDLLLSAGRAVRPDLQLTTAGAAALAEAGRLCGGLPVALLLAGARLRALTPEELLLRLREPLAVLRGGRTDIPSRHRSVEASLTAGWEGLGASARVTAAAVAVAGAPLEVEEVEALATAAGDGIDGLAAAQALAEAGVLQGGAGARLSMPWPVRAHALGTLDPTLRSALRRRLAALVRSRGDGAAAADLLAAVLPALGEAVLEEDEAREDLWRVVAWALDETAAPRPPGAAGLAAHLASAAQAHASSDTPLAMLLGLHAAWLADVAGDPALCVRALDLHRRAAAGAASGAAALQGAMPAGGEGVDTGVGELVGLRREPGSRRVVAAVLLTRLGAGERDLGDSAWLPLVGEHDALMRRLVATHRGHPVKSLGGGFLALFDAPSEAVSCAVAARTATAAMGARLSAGIHVGECHLVGDDVFGLPIHVAARLLATAAPGEVLVTAVVRDTAAGAVDVEERGVHTLRGIDGEWPLFAVVAPPGQG